MLNANQTSVAAYVRVSTEDQTERRTIEAQIDFVNRYCDMYGLPLFKIYRDDGVSGTIPFAERPGGAELLEAAKTGQFKTLLVYKLDRLGRSTRIILNTIYDLEQSGVKLKSMTEPFDTGDASGRFLLTILAGVADLERSNILERMWLGSNRAAKDGKWLGGIVPYGYRKGADKFLHPSEEIIASIQMTEADVVRLIYTHVGERGNTLINCAEYLNSLGVPTHYNLHKHTGKRIKNVAGIWRPNRVASIIRNPVYKGVHYYGKRTTKDRELIERRVPPLVSEELWKKAQAVIQYNFEKYIPNVKRQYLLRSMIQCENCGHSYHGTACNGASGKLGYYVCNRRSLAKVNGYEKCIGKTINMDWLDDLVWNACLTAINQPEYLLTEIESSPTPDASSLQAEIDVINTQLQAKETEKQNLLTLYRKNIITLADVERQILSVEKEKSTLQTRADEIRLQLSAPLATLEQRESAEELLHYLKLTLEHTECCFDVKQSIIRTLIKKIYVKTSQDGENATIRIEFAFSNYSSDIPHAQGFCAATKTNLEG